MVVAMATPINSHIYLLPESNPRNNYSRARNQRNKILTLKVLQFFLVCVDFILFVLGSSEFTNQMIDPFACMIFGMFLILPICVLSGIIQHYSKQMIFVNFCGALLLLVVGLFLTVACGSLYTMAENSLETNIESDNHNQYYINMKLLSGIVSVMNSILYFAESTIMMLHRLNNDVV